MNESADTHTLPTLVTGADGRSVWIEHAWPNEPRGGMALSPRVGCSSLRLRQSEPGYTADWHVAGEPVLIVVRQGTLRIGLQDASHRDFHAGDAFIAADAISDDQSFDDALHGHTAEVVGDALLEAIHIKLEGFEI